MRRHPIVGQAVPGGKGENFEIGSKKGDLLDEFGKPGILARDMQYRPTVRCCGGAGEIGEHKGVEALGNAREGQGAVTLDKSGEVGHGSGDVISCATIVQIGAEDGGPSPAARPDSGGREDKPIVNKGSFLPASTARLVLRRVSEADIPALVKAHTDPDINRFIERDEPDGFLWVRNMVDEMLAKEPGDAGPSGGWYQYVIAARENGRYVGDIGVCFHSPHRRQAEIGYRLLPEFQGRGYAREALHRLVTHLFDDHGLHRLVAFIATDNAPSIALVEHLGFQREGHHRLAYFCRGTWLDEYTYALLARDWPAVPDGT
ncbi:MAG: N-acetyltransferase [Alphaproteobacteria bacterium]|nr:MAG: N-acetyltransferase [Alphaproteobacteria bacterium]